MRSKAAAVGSWDPGARGGPTHLLCQGQQHSLILQAVHVLVGVGVQRLRQKRARGWAVETTS